MLICSSSATVQPTGCVSPLWQEEKTGSSLPVSVHLHVLRKKKNADPGLYHTAGEMITKSNMEEVLWQRSVLI